MTTFDPSTGREAAYRKWAGTDTKAGTRAARAGFMARFEREVDPDHILPEEERLARADRAMRAHMISLARKAHRKRGPRPVD